LSSEAPPPPPFARLRVPRPWYLVAAMILAWLIGVQGLSDSLSTLLFLHDANLPDVEALTRGIKEAKEPIEALAQVAEAARLRSLGEASILSFPLTTARFVLSILLVIASGMAMSGRPGSRTLAMQALLANAALAVVSFWMLRHARYAWADAVVQVRELMPDLNAPSPPELQAWWTRMLDRRFWLWIPRIRLILFDVGALLLSATTLLSGRTRGFFEAVKEASERSEEP